MWVAFTVRNYKTILSWTPDNSWFTELQTHISHVKAMVPHKN